MLCGRPLKMGSVAASLPPSEEPERPPMMSQVIVRDSVFLLAPIALLGFLWGGSEWGIGLLAGGATAIGNLLVLIFLVGRIFRPGGHFSALTGFALTAKMGAAGLVLFLLLQTFEPAPVFAGFGVGVVAIRLRGLKGFGQPSGAEA